MAHLRRDRIGLRNRVHRIQGQLAAVERALEADADCTTVLQRLAACRGALESLVGELIEEHIRHHVVDPDERPRSAAARGARELIAVLRSYLK